MQTSSGMTWMISWTKLALNQPWLVSRCDSRDLLDDDASWLLSGRVTCLPLCHQDIPTVKGPLPLPTSIASGSSMPSPFLMPSRINPFLHSGSQQCTVTLPPLYDRLGSSTYFGMDTFDTMPQTLNSLDSLTISDYKPGTLPSTDGLWLRWTLMMSNY